MEVTIVGRKTRAYKFAEALLPSLMDQLKLDTLRGDLLVMLGPDITSDCGISTCIERGKYLVLINTKQPLKDVGLTLAHELVHIKQLARGQLRMKGNKIVWMGRKIAPKIGYLDQPWEMEAYAKQELLLRRAIDA